MWNWKKLVGIALFCAVPFSAVPAQKIWIVDAANGPGTDFIEIQDAIDAASAPDRVLIRAGQYPHRIDVDKGISLVAVGAPVTTGVVAFNVPSGQFAALRGLDIGAHRPTYGYRTLTGVGYRGHVVLTHCRVRSGRRGTVGPFESGLFKDSTSISLNECVLDGRIRCESTNVVASDTCFADNPNGFAIFVSNARADLANCSGQGGWYEVFGTRFEDSAIVCSKAHLTLRGSRGGFAGWSNLPAIRGSDSQALIDPDVPLRAPAIDPGFGLVTRRELPDLSTGGGVLGQTVRLTVRHRANSTYALYTGLPGAPLPIPGLGTLWIDATLFGRVATGTVGATGAATTSHAIPAVANLAGLPLMYQGLTIAGGAVDLTNGAGMVLAR